jgi:AcrR family transcriptional regulator
MAAAVFLEEGFARASMSEIAARVGGSKTMTAESPSVTS